MATVTLSEMRDKLLSLDDAREVLARSEPLSELPLEVGYTTFKLDQGWNHTLDTVGDTDPIGASVSVGPRGVQLTKDALFQATAAVGLPASYVKKTPANLIEDNLNYWYGSARGLGKKNLKLLITGDVGSAVTKSTIRPFSNLRLMDEVLAGIEKRFGNGEVLVDSKFHHSLVRSHLRLIVPGQTFQIHDTGTPDDVWSIGLNVQNSLIGKDQTSVEGYLFRWWCTNGAIDTTAGSGVWNRKSEGQNEEDVYEWARTVVDDVLGGLEGAFEHLQQMARTPIQQDVHQILRETFSNYSLPARSRQAVINNLVEDDQLTAYSLMNAITSVANATDMDPREQARLMTVGGDLVHTASDRCDSCHRLIS